MSDDRTVTGAHAPIRVLIVADVRLYREGLAISLASRENLTVVGASATPSEALVLVKSGQPDVVILDMATPESLHIVSAISREASSLKVIAFAIEGCDRGILACADAGVAGYLPSDGSTDELVAMIERVTSGETQCSPRMAALLFHRLASLVDGREEPLAAAALTRRQQQIVALIDGGLSNKEIAVRLGIEVATVKNHVHSILDKLHVGTRAEAAAHLHGVPTRNGRLSPTAAL